MGYESKIYIIEKTNYSFWQLLKRLNRYLRTEKYYTEEEAVKAARKYISSTDTKYRVKIEQVCNVVGWWN